MYTLYECVSSRQVQKLRSTNPIKYNSKSTASFRHLCSFYLILVGVWFGLLHHLTWDAGWHWTTRACWSVSLPRIWSNMSGKTNWFKGSCYQHDDRYDIINISILGIPWLLYLWTFSWTLRAGRMFLIKSHWFALEHPHLHHPHLRC